MTSSRLPEDSITGLKAWAQRYQETYGLPPMAGGETPDQALAPEAPAPDAGAAGAGAEGVQAADQPEWAQQLSSRMDEVVGRLDTVAPPQPAGPGLVDVLAGVDPNQPQGPQGQMPQQGQPQEPQGPGQQVDETEQLVQEFIQSEAQKAAQQMLQPYVQQQEQSRIRDEGYELLENYPELKEAETANSLMGSAQRMAQELGIPGAVREPGFLELVHLASRQLEAQRSETPAAPGNQQQQQQPGAVQLETGNGANPGPGTSPNDDLASQIVAAGNSGLNSFWGG